MSAEYQPRLTKTIRALNLVSDLTNTDNGMSFRTDFGAIALGAPEWGCSTVRELVRAALKEAVAESIAEPRDPMELSEKEAKSKITEALGLCDATAAWDRILDVLRARLGPTIQEARAKKVVGGSVSVSYNHLDEVAAVADKFARLGYEVSIRESGSWWTIDFQTTEK
jgi:hypothetical protein